ncbi:enoyl-CoA hydratase-related protein [Shouchella shacheensis]|uniref:enoyl-CoA hydratase-related protein n=1 Tax=Shouchella shacheensis TaxID=1649580 RepID=UPI0007402347|nr:enoyl-CoA hydratase-related protein [Shouchella shacheensis]
MEKVLFEERDHIGYVTINRPDVLNCFDYETLSTLQAIVEQISYSSSIRVVIFTGAGEKAFSAGADLKERQHLTEAETRRNVAAIQRVFQSIASLPQPTIAAVNGYALGGGFEWLLACDFAIAAQGASMGLTETSWAIIPGAGGTQRLPRLIGEMKAKELILTAKTISAEEALDLGIVLAVRPRDQILHASVELAHAMMKNGPVALRQAKHAIVQGMNTDIQTGMGVEAKAYERTLMTQDRMEALQAFAERREPNFSGK